MEYWTNHPDLQPSVLSAFATQVLEERPIEEHILDQWFPVAINPNLAYEIDKGQLRTYTTALGYRAYDAEPGPGQRYGYETLTGKLPPFGQFLPLTEGELLQLQRSNVPTWVSDKIYGDTEALVRALQNRHEIDRGLTLRNAALTLTGNLTSLSVDWSRDASNEVTVGTLWNAGGTPFTDERTVYRYLRDNYRTPAIALAPSEVIDVMETHADYLAAYQGITGAAVAPTLITLEQINLVRRQYDLPPITRYDAKVETEAASAAKVIGVDSIIYLPNGPVGQTQYGRPLTANEPEINISTDLGGPVVFVAKEKAVPIRYRTYIDGIGIPLLGDANSTAVITVL